MKKKLLAIILALATAASTAVFTASASQTIPEGSQAAAAQTVGITSDDYYVTELEDGTLSVKYSGNDTDVVVPSEIDGKKVTALGDYAFSSSECESVVLPDSITSIGSSIFYGTPKPKTVNLPTSIPTITTWLLTGCHNLTDIELPDSVTPLLS